MREELKILLLGIGVLIIGGLTLTFYQSLDLSRPTPNLATPVGMDISSDITPDFYTLATTQPSLSLLIGTTTLNLELATTSSKREQGLSNRESLPAETGLLFVFEKPGLYGFWMKEMNFPIDIIWLNQKGEIVDITKEATPGSYPHVFYPAEPALYVLEVKAGFTTQNQLEVGDSLEALL